MRADDERRVPVPPKRIIIATGLRLNRDTLAGALVETGESAVLRLGVDRIRIFLIYLRAKTIASVGNKPIGIRDPGSAPCAGWTTKTEVVLRTAINVVERLRVVSRDVVEPCNWKVLFEIPGLAAIKTLINTAVAADEIVIGIVGIDPDVVIIDVLVAFAEPSQRAAAVVRHH